MHHDHLSHIAAEQKQTISPRITRAMTRQQQLIQQCKSDGDNVIMLVSCDDVFPCIHFDDGHDSPDRVSSFQATSYDPVTPIESLQTSPMVPSSDVESLHSPQADKWEIARQEELQSCKVNGVWSKPMLLPEGHKAVNLGFVYALKHSAGKNSPVRYKARIVFKNHKFATSSTWEESFSPMVDKTTLRLFYTMVGRRQLFLRQADVVTAYLNSAMPDEVYVRLPSICGDQPGYVRRLYKALYGHPKAGNLWNCDFVTFARIEGFQPTARDKCLFFRPRPYFLLALYVDDLLGACECSRFLKKFFNKLAATFKIRDLGSPSSFLGIDVCYDSDQRCVALSQQNYILDLATKFNLPPTLRPVTPIRSDYYSQLEAAQPQPVLEEVPYRELVGALIFVMVCTRPDIAFAVACLTQYFSAPRALHWEQALRCLGYLVGTSSFGILLGAGGPDELVAFSDSDWAGDPVTRRSIGGYIIFFGNSVLCWSSKTQRGIIALSSTESEFIQLALSVRQLLFIQPIFQDIGFQNIE